MKSVVLPKRPVKKNRTWKGIFVVILASLLSTLAIHASDSFRTPTGLSIAGVGGATASNYCPPEMVYIPSSGGGFCIDRYEESPSKDCPRPSPVNQFETEENFKDPSCLPVSVKSAVPWVNVPEHTALSLCAKAGKRLPSNAEWYRASLGTPDEARGKDSPCALDHVGQIEADRTGSHDKCISSYGVYDMIGNVWEWIDATSVDGKYGDRFLPQEGFVAEVDADGVPSRVGTTSDPSFGDDYFYVDHNGVKGMFRGGFWSMGEKAGVYGMNMTISTNFVGNAVGFRCVRDVR